MAVPYTFANATTSIPLSQLDNNFATAITLGNATLLLGNATTTVGNLTLTNVTVNSVSTPITVAQGGTGSANLTLNNVILGNNTGVVKVVAPGTAGNVLTSNGTIWLSQASSGSQKFVQAVSTQTGAVGTTTTLLPYDDTIPQNTEGAEFMTLAITPTSATNKLRIDVVVYATQSASDALGTAPGVALFQDSTASALAAGNANNNAGNLASMPIVFSHVMDAGTTSATTFKVRAGPHTAGTLTFNGRNSARIYGGVMASSIRITEYVP